MPVRSARAVRTWADRSAACTAESPPLRFPIGVRTASTMTASRILLLQFIPRVASLVPPGGRYGPAAGELAGRLLAANAEYASPESAVAKLPGWARASFVSARRMFCWRRR